MKQIFRKLVKEEKNSEHECDKSLAETFTQQRRDKYVNITMKPWNDDEKNLLFDLSYLKTAHPNLFI